MRITYSYLSLQLKLQNLVLMLYRPLHNSYTVARDFTEGTNGAMKRFFVFVV